MTPSISAAMTSPSAPASDAGPSTTPRPRRPSHSTPLPPLLPISSFPTPAPPPHAKPSGYTFYHTTLGSPRHIVAPMVAASELPWRKLSRRIGGADLCYSPMISSSSFVNSLRAKGKSAQRSVLNWFNTATREEGHGQDSKLIIQLAGNDPTVLLEAATHLQSHCLGIDLNLGCPQHIAKRGHYGSFLQEDWPLIHSLISTLHTNLTVPVTAKMRVFPSVEHTIAYARMLEHAGAQIITVHGRTREQKGHKTGLADWEMIRAVKSAVSVPVFANGNVLYREDVEACLSATGADGVMSAEGNLYNPLIFAGEQLLSSLPTSLLPYRDSDASPEAAWRSFPYIPALAHEYLDEVAACRKRVDHSAVKGHMFKICRPALERHKELRGVLGKAQLRYVDAEEREEEAGQGQGEAVVREYREAVSALDEKLTADKQDPLYLQPPKDWGSSSLSASVTEEKYVPHWLAQPYFRPALPLPEEKTKGEKKGEVEKVGVDTRDVQGRGEKRVVDLEEANGGEANEKGNAEDGHKKVRLSEPTTAAQNPILEV
ncbi:Dus-domain-containing protein [Jaminaea rosea]|uniref:tRNA-dihydrouridine(16/17) synthase [NAD(P)(+)] n=1 Tax=Jaminaea rosea TaxID=1569628 RepID=A0A316UGX4_9BASI|nr:Dus-domain-containing protein [Jaminaea rosea]PWN24512.1 Dus-domain-containing protein [Jaminaea rosea]